MVITDKVIIQNGADFTFVCGKIPFAVSCSSNLPHRSFNMIDLDLVNKMKIPLKNIRVTRISIQGHDLRCVGFVSQTIQCVADGKISGMIHLHAKVVRDLFNSISADCIASRRTYSRLMGEDPPVEPPDDPSIEVLGGDDEEDDDDSKDATSSLQSDAKGDDVLVSNAEVDDVVKSDAEGDDTTADAEGGDVTAASSKLVHPDDPEPCYDSDGNYNELLTRFVNGEFPDYDYYEGGALYKITTKSSKKSGGRKSTIQASREEKHCQFCFLSGQPIKVTRSHNDMDINCASMSDVDRRRIHGDKETNRWLARQHGYYD